MKRVIVYGDIHGCLEELSTLRQKIAPQKGDIELSVGDILNKGPYLGREMIRYCLREGIKVVVGNNEAKALKQYKKYQKEGMEYLQTLRPFEIATVLSLREEDALFLEELPYFRRIHNLTILHGGILPGMVLEKLDTLAKKEITLIRYLDKNLKPIPWSDTQNRYKFWSEIYDGSQGFIVAGHHPFPKPKVDTNAMDIDTGCVYGGALSAAIFPLKKERIDTKNVTFVSQKSQKDYWNLYLKGNDEKA